MRTLEIYGQPVKHYSGMLMVGDYYLTASKKLTSSPVYAMKTNLSSQNLRRTIQNDPRITGVLFLPYYKWSNPRACHGVVEKNKQFHHTDDVDNIIEQLSKCKSATNMLDDNMDALLFY